MNSELYRQNILIPTELFLQKVTRQYYKTKNIELKKLLIQTEDLWVHCLETYSKLLNCAQKKEN